VEEQRQAEEARLQAEAARQAEEQRRVEETRRTEEARRAEEARRRAEEARRVEAARRVEEARRQEEIRRQAEAEAARRAEEARRQEEARQQAEAARQAEEAAAAARKAEARQQAEAARQAAILAALPGSYTVRAGDTLWSIAGSPEVFNDPLQWRRLYEANREDFVDPRNPNLLSVGQTVTIPARRVTSNARYYEIRPGDSFISIAANPAVYNDQYQWELLYNANRELLPNPDNPHILPEGTVIEIPNRAGENREGLF
jgi:nucleoid-associated protein YgaU